MFVELSVFNLALFIFLSRGVVPLVFRVRPKIVILNSTVLCIGANTFLNSLI